VIEVDAPLAPVPRRVIVERMSNLPPRPQDIIVEKWLPYRPQKRRVVYQRAGSLQQLVPRNLIIEWEAPDVEIVKQCKDLGVMDADPEDYIRRFGGELKQANELPTCDVTGGTRSQVSVQTKTQAVCTNCSIHCPGNQRLASASTTIITASVRDNRCPIHFGAGPLQQARSSHFSDSTPDLEGDLEALRYMLKFWHKNKAILYFEMQIFF
jgi:hypothetical protein